LTGWESELVSEALAQAPDRMRELPRASRRGRRRPSSTLVPAAQATASIEATLRLQALTQPILDDIGNAWSGSAGELVDLHERLDGEWRSWRQALGAGSQRSAAGAEATRRV
jgi:hypothetical protein